MNFFILALDVIDLIALILLLFGKNAFLVGPLLSSFGWLMLLKGIVSMAISFPLGFFDWMGIMDTIAGISLMVRELFPSIVGVFSLLYLLKVSYVFLRTILNF